MRSRKWLALFAVLTALALILGGCTAKAANNNTKQGGTESPPAQTDPNKPVDGGTMTVAMISDIVNINPIMIDDVPSGDVAKFVLAYLYDYDSSGKLEVNPHTLAAELPIVSPDGATYTIKLKTGPKWTDGTPVTADDVLYTIKTLADVTTASPNYTSFSTIKDVRIKDATTVEIQLKNPDSRFALNALNWQMVQAKAFQGGKPEEVANHPYGVDIQKTVTNGPYLWKEWVEKQYVRLEANPDYWGPKPHIQTVIIKPYATQDTAVQAVMSGEVDIVQNAPVPQLDAIKATKGLSVNSKAGASYDYISFNFKPDNFPDNYSPFTGKKTRQALNYAIDRKGMVDSILKGYGTLLDGPFLTTSWAFTPGASFSYPFDPNKAKQLLADDGWKAGSDGMLVKDGHKFEFDMYVSSSNKRRNDYAAVVQQNLKDVGIRVTVKPMDFSALIPQYITPGKFQAYLGGWQNSLDPDGESIFSSHFFPDAGQNSGFFVNEKTDQLWIDGYLTSDIQKRKAIYTEIAREYNDDPPYVFLCAPNVNMVVNSRIHWAEADQPILSLPYGWSFHYFNWWVTK